VSSSRLFKIIPFKRKGDLMMKILNIKTVLFVALASVLFLSYLNQPTNALEEDAIVEITTSPTGYLFQMTNLKPGDTGERILTIKNTGNQNYYYSVRAQMKSGSNKFYKQLLLKVKDTSQVLYDGKLSEFTSMSERYLAHHTQEDLTFAIEFPWNSGNEFQGLLTEVELIFYAEGRNNPPDDGDPPDPPDDGDPPDPPDDGDPPDPPDDGDPPDPPDDGDPPDPPDDGDPPDPPDDGDPPDPPDDNEPPTDDNEPPSTNEPPTDDNEPPSTNEPPSNNPTPTKPADPPSKDTGSLPQTGEENPIFIILSGFFILLAGLGLLLIKKSIIPNPFKRG
jgi:LPXTG-motif cell wall-anchored protein